MTHRDALMTQRSRSKNHVQGLLAGLLLRPPCKVLWTKTGMAWLGGLELPAHVRLMLDSELRQVAAADAELAALDAELVASTKADPRVRLLMTIPGVNYVVALGLLAALGDIARFRDGDHAASYLGLVPSTRQSGRRCHHGPSPRRAAARPAASSPRRPSTPADTRARSGRSSAGWRSGRAGRWRSRRWPASW
jgi:transposase